MIPFYPLSGSQTTTNFDQQDFFLFCSRIFHTLCLSRENCDLVLCLVQPMFYQLPHSLNIGRNIVYLQKSNSDTVSGFIQMSCLRIGGIVGKSCFTVVTDKLWQVCGFKYRYFQHITGYTRV